MADGEAASAAKKAERRTDPKFGDEFKAEVCCIRTMGRYKILMYVFILAKNVKKGDANPYAYLPLSQTEGSAVGYCIN